MCNPETGLASHLHLIVLREGCAAIAVSHIGCFGATSDAGLWLVMLSGWERLSMEGTSFDGKVRRTQASLAFHSQLGARLPSWAMSLPPVEGVEQSRPTGVVPGTGRGQVCSVGQCWRRC